MKKPIQSLPYSMKLSTNFSLKHRNRIYYGKRRTSFHLELFFRLHSNDFLRSSMSYSNCITVIFSVEFNKSVKHIVVSSHSTCIHPTGCQTFQITTQPRNKNRKWKCDSVYSILDLVRWMWEFEIHWWKMIAQILNSRCKVQRIHFELNNSFIWKFHFEIEYSVPLLNKCFHTNVKTCSGKSQKKAKKMCPEIVCTR